MNLANLAEAEHGLAEAEEAISAYLEKASALLDTESVPHDGYYAFVCEKCAPTIDYYGWFIAANDLKERAKAIYERA